MIKKNAKRFNVVTKKEYLLNGEKKINWAPLGSIVLFSEQEIPSDISMKLEMNHMSVDIAVFNTEPKTDKDMLKNHGPKMPIRGF